MSVANNRDCFISTKECHSDNTRQINNLHLPQVILTVFKMGVYYSSVKIFNSPFFFKEIPHNPKKFKPMLKNFFRLIFLQIRRIF